MKENLANAIEYIEDNVVYGSSLKQTQIDRIFTQYSLTDNERASVWEDLKSLKIKVMPSLSDIKENYNDVFKLAREEKRISEGDLLSWFTSQNMSQQDQSAVRDFLNQRGYVVLKREQKVLDADQFSFLDDDSSENDLDQLLDDDDFQKQIIQLKEAPDKKLNNEYLAILSSKEASIADIESSWDNLVRANQKLGWKIVRRYIGLETSSLSEDDMFQAGMEGLMKAARKFDLSLGYEFSTYATWWIRQSITREIADYSTTVRVPVHMYEKINKIKKIEKRLYYENGIPPTNEEIAKVAEEEVSKVVECKKYAHFANIKSLDDPIKDGDNTPLEDFIPESEEKSPEEILLDLDTNERLDKILKNNLTEREECIIRRRYGFGSFSISTLEEIGEDMGVTRERVRQIQKKAEIKLKREIEFQKKITGENR